MEKNEPHTFIRPSDETIIGEIDSNAKVTGDVMQLTPTSHPQYEQLFSKWIDQQAEDLQSGDKDLTSILNDVNYMKMDAKASQFPTLQGKLSQLINNGAEAWVTRASANIEIGEDGYYNSFYSFLRDAKAAHESETPLLSPKMRETIAKAVSSKLEERLAYIIENGKSENQNSPIATLRSKIEKIHEIGDNLFIPSGFEKCSKAIATIEQQLFDEIPEEDAIAYLDEQISDGEGRLREMAGDLRDYIHSYTNLEDESDLEKAIQISSLLNFEGDYATYTYTDKMGNSTQWMLGRVSSTRLPSDTTTFFLRNVDHPEMMISVDPENSNIDPLLTKDNLDSLVERAIETSEKEKASADVLEKFDLLDGLPKDAQVIHIRVCSTHSNKVATPGISASMLLAGGLRAKYGDTYVSYPLVFTNDPANHVPTILEKVKKQYPGPKRILMDFIEHGSQEGFEFNKRMSGTQLLNLMADAKDQNTLLASNTIACYGANIMPEIDQELLTNPDKADGLAFFTQT